MKKSIENKDEPADDPEDGSQPVCPVPVFRVMQGPWQANTHRIILVVFRHIISHENENDTHADIADQTNIHRKAQSIGIRAKTAQQRDDRNESENNREHFSADILPFRIV